MRYVPIDNLPEVFSRSKRSFNNNLKKLILNFYHSPHDYAEVIFDDSEYASSNSLSSGISRAIQVLHLEDDLKVQQLQGKVYLRRI